MRSTDPNIDIFKAPMRSIISLMLGICQPWSLYLSEINAKSFVAVGFGCQKNLALVNRCRRLEHSKVEHLLELFLNMKRSGAGGDKDVGQVGPTEGSGAITMILHNVPEESGGVSSGVFTTLIFGGEGSEHRRTSWAVRTLRC
jgi:hypothetical protein